MRLRFETLEARRLLAFDPSPLEQELLLLVNRMRTDPQAEFGKLIDGLAPIHSPDPDIDFAVQFFDVDGPTLRSQWNSLTPVQPLAWSETIYSAAHGHNNAMIAAQLQSHQVPGEDDLGERLTAAGYNWNSIAENIYCYALTPNFAHGGFAIDWGGGPTGIQDPPGHRINIMNSKYREAGIAVTSFDNGSFGPLVVTQDFGNRFNFGNSFVVGAIWSDANQSGWYDAGEGLAGVTVEFTRPGSPPVYVAAMSAGGYQMQLAPGTYTARAFGGNLPIDLVASNIVVGAENVMVNFVLPTNTTPTAVDDRALTMQNVAVAIAVRANDSDADGNLGQSTIDVTDTPLGSQADIDHVSGVITFTPPVDFAGAAELRYRLRDPQGFVSNEATVVVAVLSPSAHRYNPLERRDVDFDGLVTAIDVALVINAINAAQSGPQGDYSQRDSLAPLFDTTGDNFLAPIDAAEVINFINAGGNGEEAARLAAHENLFTPEAPSSLTIDALEWHTWAWWWTHLDTQREERARLKPVPAG